MTAPEAATDETPAPDPAAPPGRLGCLGRILVVLGVLVALVFAAAGVGLLWSRSNQDLELPADDEPLPTNPTVTSPLGPARYTKAFIQQGINRREIEYVLPPDVTPGERLPAVVVLHGASNSPWLMQSRTGLGQAVVDRRFVAVFPHGVASSWNAGRCCRPAMTLGIDDLAFIDAVVDDVARRPEVDPDRIHMVGESNGGIMTYRYLCDHAGRLAGAASVVGTNLSDCVPNEPVPVVHVAASSDEVVPYSGGSTASSRVLARSAFPPVAESMKAIAAAARCSPTPETDVDGPAEVVEWTDCGGGATVRLVTVVGAKHGWPRGEQFDATDEILDFFGLVED